MVYVLLLWKVVFLNVKDKQIMSAIYNMFSKANICHPINRLSFAACRIDKQHFMIAWTPKISKSQAKRDNCSTE